MSTRNCALIAALCSLMLAAGAGGTVRASTPTDAPIASFTTSPAPVVGHPVTFDASASKDPDGEAIASYQWTFGDGVTQTTSSPTTTHVYEAAGSFSVALTVEDSKGNSGAPVKHAVRISADKPTAKFSVKPSSAFAGTTVNFSGAASADSDGDAIVSYRWDFGDGSTQTTSVAAASHVYGAVGTFTATLTVVDSHGNASSPVSHPVKVNPPIPVPTPPTARFTFSPAHPVTGQFVTFNASASGDPDGDTIKSYRWSFGDHSAKTTTAAVIGHVYARAGTFPVQLVVVDSHGSPSKATSHKLTVSVPPPPQISQLHIRVCVHKSKRCRRRGLYVRFTLSVADRVVITVNRRHDPRKLKRVAISSRAGRDRSRILFAGMRPGHYVLGAHAIGGGTAVAQFAWRAR
jgi:large repetitive protein